MSNEGSRLSKDLLPVKRDIVNKASSEQPERVPNNTQQSSRIQIKNRRKAYLDRHPSYFDALDLELADPLLYDHCVRRFQSPLELEAEARAKGYSGVLEADLYRSEAKREALKIPSHAVGVDSRLFSEDLDEVPVDKEAGWNRWKRQMTLRFLNGNDQDFPYIEIDEDERLDGIEEREAEDRWFEDEVPQWVGEGNVSKGETGVQDF